MSPSALPASFKSLYRLHLRTVSAAVLHHKHATRNLRRLWRPNFDSAAQVSLQLADPAKPIKKEERQRLENWLAEWNKRIDRTLLMLYTSSQSRGLPHQLVRNLALLMHGEWERDADRKHLPWSPNNPVDSPLYTPGGRTKLTKRWQDKEQEMAFKDDAYAALGEVVRLAEAHSHVLFGRLDGKKTFKR